MRLKYALLLVSLTAGPALAEPASFPGLGDLPEGWTTITPGGETSCAFGDEFKFHVRPGSPERLFVYLQGGGGCWNAETCDPERQPSPFLSSIDPADHPSQHGGFFDFSNPDNPLADYSMVVVPTCTGDVFLGARDAVYTLENSDGDRRAFTIRHRGKINTSSAHDWIAQNFDAPAEVFVAGSSAGAVGMAFHASLLAQRYPGARVVGLGDDASAYGSVAFAHVSFAQWGYPEVLQQYPGWETTTESFGVDHFIIRAAAAAPNLRLFQVDHAHDVAQGAFLGLAGVEDQVVLNQIRATRASIGAGVADFASFTIGGYAHEVLTHDHLYAYHTDGTRLIDWLSAIASGNEVASVDCAQCSRPGLLFTDTDLRILDRALELLSGPERWLAGDGGPCRPDAEQFSLLCASFIAVFEVTGRPPAGMRNIPAALWDIAYTADERAPFAPRTAGLVAFNSHPSTTAEDVIGLLNEVRDRVLAGLDHSAAASAAP